jgi:hypothetical protein
VVDTPDFLAKHSVNIWAFDLSAFANHIFVYQEEFRDPPRKVKHTQSNSPSKKAGICPLSGSKVLQPVNTQTLHKHILHGFYSEGL